MAPTSEGELGFELVVAEVEDVRLPTLVPNVSPPCLAQTPQGRWNLAANLGCDKVKTELKKLETPIHVITRSTPDGLVCNFDAVSSLRDDGNRRNAQCLKKELSLKTHDPGDSVKSSQRKSAELLPLKGVHDGHGAQRKEDNANMYLSVRIKLL